MLMFASAIFRSHIVITAKDDAALMKGLKKKVKHSSALVALFVTDDRLKRSTISIFACVSPKSAHSVCDAVNKAFKVRCP